MDIHHAMMVRNQSARVHEALTRSSELTIGMDGGWQQDDDAYASVSYRRKMK